MSFGHWAFGVLEARVTAADLASFLSDLEKAGITVEMAQQREEMTLSFTFFRRDHHTLRRLCEKKGYDLEITGRSGAHWTLVALVRRPVLLAGLLLLTILSLWAPGRIFFVFVEGNKQVPANQIMEQAASCGITFGAQRRLIRSENMKNGLLERMPQLQWAGVNTYGCVAVISVTERMPDSKTPSLEGVSSIVAGMDAVVRELTVTSGSALCTVGQTVKAGQVLISGYTDCGICIRAGQANGEIFGETQRNISAVLPISYSARGNIVWHKAKFSLIIGKKRINFDNNSGILGGECVKIYKEQYMMLPGGFRLPVAIVTEQYYSYETEPVSMEDPESVLLPYVENYLHAQMLAGRILSQIQTVTQTAGLYRIDSIFSCYEMIGILRPEESLPEYENNRTDRQCRTGGRPDGRIWFF